MTATLTVADVCDRAAALIERNGWHHGGYYRANAHSKPADCPMCVRGAINTAVFGEPVPGLPGAVAWLHVEFAEQAVREFLDLGTNSLAKWNDAEGRTYTEVIAALRGAAQTERERAAAPA